MEKIEFYNQEKEKLIGILHDSKKKTDKGIILVHGFKGNKDHAFIPKLANELSKKYNVLRFDFSGNGESEGKFEDQCYSKYIEELKIAIDYFKNKEIKKICLIGHSLGGNIVLFEEDRYNNSNLKILIAPALKSRNEYSFIKNILFSIIKSGNIPKRKFFIERILYNPIKSIKGNEYVILAEKDKAIDLEKSIKLCEKYNISHKIIENAKHNFHDEESYNKLKNEIIKLLKYF